MGKGKGRGEGVGKKAEKEVGKGWEKKRRKRWRRGGKRGGERGGEGRGGEGSLKSISWRYTDNKVCTETYIWFSLPSSLEWSLRAK